jgi:hypothetical protein
MQLKYKMSDDVSQYLIPDGSGSVDVVNDFNWTLTPKAGRKGVPKAYITEYQQSAGQLVASILYLYRLGLTGAANLTGRLTADQLYRYKYIAKATGFSYVFPYFNTKKFSRSTSFEPEEGHKIFGSIKELGSAVVGGHNDYGGGKLAKIGVSSYKWSSVFNAAKDFVNLILPGQLNMDLPEAWHGTTEGDYTITFDLFNSGTSDDVINNRNLCYILAYQNTQSRRNAIITDPVCIYEVKIGDVVHMPAAAMTSLEITNLGNTTSMSFDGVKKIIPEAYRINMTFRSLLQPSRQIMNGLDTGETVTAIGEDENWDTLVSLYKNAFQQQVAIQNSTQIPVIGGFGATSGLPVSLP